MRPWTAAVLALAFAMPLAAGVPRALAVEDGDGDGVANESDACPDTATYDLVDAAGCSVCDCGMDAGGEPWSSRTAYLRCVYGEIRDRRANDLIERKAARMAVRAARTSTCGQPTKVRCCIMFDAKDEGMCRVMDELRCDEELLRADAVEDLGPGSCLPNPCLH